jgi:arsenite methyltransferase
MSPSNERPADPQELRERVSEGYSRIAEGESRGAAEAARRVGYEAEQLSVVPEGANLGVGCGNPTAIDALRPGEVVVDLGCGAGMDSFLAARAVGAEGRVIGIDMTDAMIEKARANAESAGFGNVEFRKGYIEALPIADESVDVIISNCVINLSPEKHKVYSEAYRVLRSGGRVMVSDVVLERVLPDAVLQSIDAYIGCVGGASLREPYLQTIRDAGFSDVQIQREACFGDTIDLDDPAIQEAMGRLEIDREQAREYGRAVTSLHIFARK